MSIESKNRVYLEILKIILKEMAGSWRKKRDKNDGVLSIVGSFRLISAEVFLSEGVTENELGRFCESLYDKTGIDILGTLRAGFTIDTEEQKQRRIIKRYLTIPTDRETLEKLKKLSKELKQDTPLFELPADTGWKDIKISFQNEYDVKIYIKTKFFQESDNIKMGFFRSGTKDKKPDNQWGFLRQLAIINVNKQILKPTIEEMARTLKIKKEACMKTKSKLEKKLQEVLGIKDLPFEEYKESEGYKTRFELEPEQILRGSGDVFISNKYSGYDDDKQYEDLEGVD